MKTIPLTDPRFTAIALTASSALPAVDAADLSGVVTPAGAAPAPIPVIPQNAPEVRRDGNRAYFKVGDLADGSPAEIAVHIENETLAFFPERSSAHRQLLATLGIDE